ncbi:hypothetical protein ACLOJK_040802 [Asimina triloba]
MACWIVTVTRRRRQICHLPDPPPGSHSPDLAAHVIEEDEDASPSASQICSSCRRRGGWVRRRCPLASSPSEMGLLPLVVRLRLPRATILAPSDRCPSLIAMPRHPRRPKPCLCSDLARCRLRRSRRGRILWRWVFREDDGAPNFDAPAMHGNLCTCICFI